jgi:hypothetical protein
MALLINAYNAGVIKTILSRYPVKSPMDIPGVWDQSLVQIGRKTRKSKLPGEPSLSAGASDWSEASHVHSLSQIELMLRRGFRDEKIIFALSRGTKSSPRLRRDAYTGPLLEGQLYVATKEFVNDNQENQIVLGEQKIMISRIFQWYAGDFLVNWSNFPEEVKWNPQEMAVLSFLAHYLNDAQKVEYLKDAKYKVKYSIFNWRLNNWSPEQAGAVG